MGAAGRQEDIPSKQEDILGVLGADYHKKRKSLLSHRYRLQRRTDEVQRAIETYGPEQVRRLVDVGTADAAMLDMLAARLGNDIDMVGLDLSLSLLQCYEGEKALLAQSDASALPLADDTADVLVATAVIEHVSDPRQMLAECRRVISKDGLLIITTPAPVIEEIATFLRLLDEDQHNETFTLGKLKRVVGDCGFEVLEAMPFMFSPIGFPFEKTIEKAIRPIGLGIFMANQLVVARKVG